MEVDETHIGNADAILPRVDRVFGNLKTWLRGTHHGVENIHLPAYLYEFRFRFGETWPPTGAGSETSAFGVCR